MDPFIKEKVNITCEKLKELSERTVLEVPEMKYIPCEYKVRDEIPTVDSGWKAFKRGDTVSGKDKHFWFYTEIKTPSADKDKRIMLEMITGHEGLWDATNPQGLLYLDGEIVQGLDINHRQALLEADREYKVMLYFYMGMTEMTTEVKIDIKEVDIPVYDLYYDLKVPYDAAMCFDEREYAHIRTLKHLEHACNLIDLRYAGSREFYDTVAAASRYIKEEYFEKECGSCDAVVNYVGHTHIDVAWLWTLAQTREKTQRSFATVLNLMSRYPEYVFMSSQPQLYEYLKEDEPKLYARVKEKIKEGRWEAEGAMWLEADCNLSSGESLIRQVMHGKRFMKDEFGVDSKILWLPDVFGYSAALPQILKKCGVEKFVTSKISWSESNTMPYDSFMWEGVDGTEIFTYFITAQNHEAYLKNENFSTYVGMVNPQMNLGTWERYQQKEYNNETIVTFGFGDGGGGPTAEMLETRRRLEHGLVGMPKAKISRAGDFLERVENNFRKNCEFTKRTPKWVGELYLEFHRGTYTSIAKNKKNNRDSEFLLEGAETLSVIGELLQKSEYPAKAFHDNWRVVLLNQFHDIIPGSSIYEVYEESDRQYAALRDEIGGIKDGRLKAIADNVDKKGIFVYNPNSFAASGYAKCGDETVYAESIPPMGWKVIEGKPASDRVMISERKIESAHYTVCFDENMNISSIYDKDNCREALAGGMSGNRLMVYEDYPRQYDNWEITSYYKQKMWEINGVESVEEITGEDFGGFKLVRKYMNSTISQTILLYNNSRRIDVKNEIDWHEKHVLLKAVFPTNVHTNKATYEIQFGNVERPNHENTSWDKAKFEVCAHKWGDLSEDDYGVSILNDCKYGYSASGGEITLTLIKCGTYPNPEADQGLHTFTYSIYPHKDGFKKGGTINEAYLLNRPLEALRTEGGGSLPSEYSLISCDSENIIIETVKKAEDGNGIIVRLYDAWDRKSEPSLKFGFDAKKIYICDMLENRIEEIGSGNTVKLPVKNFEIVTLRIEL